jgi:hypothetical protein
LSKYGRNLRCARCSSVTCPANAQKPRPKGLHAPLPPRLLVDSGYQAWPRPTQRLANSPENGGKLLHIHVLGPKSIWNCGACSSHWGNAQKPRPGRTTAEKRHVTLSIRASATYSPHTPARQSGRSLSGRASRSGIRSRSRQFRSFISILRSSVSVDGHVTALEERHSSASILIHVVRLPDVSTVENATMHRPAMTVAEGWSRRTDEAPERGRARHRPIEHVDPCSGARGNMFNAGTLASKSIWNCGDHPASGALESTRGQEVENTGDRSAPLSACCSCTYEQTPVLQCPGTTSPPHVTAPRDLRKRRELRSFISILRSSVSIWRYLNAPCRELGGHFGVFHAAYEPEVGAHLVSEADRSSGVAGASRPARTKASRREGSLRGARTVETEARRKGVHRGGPSCRDDHNAFMRRTLAEESIWNCGARTQSRGCTARGTSIDRTCRRLEFRRNACVRWYLRAPKKAVAGSRPQLQATRRHPRRTRVPQCRIEVPLRRVELPHSRIDSPQSRITIPQCRIEAPQYHIDSPQFGIRNVLPK